MSDQIVIKNWEKFQHYKSGRGAPPWIKLYRDLLNDLEWFQLDAEAAKFLVNCWILAAETDGVLPDIKLLAFRLRLDIKVVAKHLSACQHWIISSDSNLLATRKQLATPETETETETEKDKKATSVATPEGVSQEVWQDFLRHRKAKKSPVSTTALNGIKKEAQKAGIGLQEALEMCCQRGWVGFKAEWLASKTYPNQQPQLSTADPDSRASIEAEGIAKGIGPWNEGMEQWHVYKAKVRGRQEQQMNIAQLALMAQRRAA